MASEKVRQAKGEHRQQTKGGKSNRQDLTRPVPCSAILCRTAEKQLPLYSVGPTPRTACIGLQLSSPLEVAQRVKQQGKNSIKSADFLLNYSLRQILGPWGRTKERANL